jgi:hypothetical protein
MLRRHFSAHADDRKKQKSLRSNDHFDIHAFRLNDPFPRYFHFGLSICGTKFNFVKPQNRKYWFTFEEI